MSLQFKETEHNGAPVLELEGRIKGEGDERLQKKLESYLQGSAAKIVVDITNADYIDSHGLGILIYIHKMLQGKKRKLVLVNSNNDPSSYMSRLIEITNLDKVLTVAPSREKT